MSHPPTARPTGQGGPIEEKGPVESRGERTSRSTPGRPSPRAMRRAAGALLLAAAIYATLRWALVPYRIAGSSMLPTLAGGGAGGEGDVVLVNRLAYALRSPERWDVVVVQTAGADPDHPGESVKRVVGLPGETVEIREGRVWVDGTRAEPPAALAEIHVVSKGPHGHGPVALHADEYFLLGDNSYVSSDSRSWGPARRDALQGRAVVVCWPPGRLRWIH